MSIEFEDNSVEVKEAVNDAIIAWLYEAAGELDVEIFEWTIHRRV